MKKLAIIGSGGHCRAILAVLNSLDDNNEPNIIFDLSEPNKDEKIFGIPVLKILSDDMLIERKNQFKYILAIGDNYLRERIFNKLNNIGCEIMNVISPSATISYNVKIGNGVVIFPNSFIGPGVKIDNNTIINTSSIVEHDSVIGSHTHLAPASVICGKSTIGDFCFIGANSTIVDKISVSSNTIVGAGSVVIKSININGQTWAGNPSKKISK